MTDCVFCAIAQGQAPAHRIYEDERVLAFLDVNPHQEGHLLVIPRDHIPHFIDLDPELYLHMMTTAGKMASLLDEVFSPPRVGMVIAGFEVPHTHVHVLPLKRHTLLTARMVASRVVRTSQQELSATAERLRSQLDR